MAKEITTNINNNNQEIINKVNDNNYMYIKDDEGYVKKIKKSEYSNKYTPISEEEWAELSGENYYKQNFTHGGARQNSGRKKLNRTKSIRVTIEEKNLIIYIRNNFISPEQILNNVNTMVN